MVEQGFANAQYNLGLKYLAGIGIGKDVGKAKEWFQKAASQGHPQAQQRLRVQTKQKYVTTLSKNNFCKTVARTTPKKQPQPGKGKGKGNEKGKGDKNEK